MRKALASFLRNEGGAVAPIVALSMFGLIAAGGVAFDYARLATMDTELQQAADQAALAAAGQLDRVNANAATGELGSQARARAAINGTAANRLASNDTRFANDGIAAGVEFTVANITFCKEYDDSKPDASACTAATDSADSRFVIVTTTARTANYAFTPIVAAVSGTSSATAVAGVESAICNIAPLFVCTDDTDFPGEGDIGRGLLLKTGSGNSWAPGNYGLLDFGAGNGGAINALLGHGLNGCQSTGETDTLPGNKDVTDAINTRLDVYAGSPLTKDPAVCNTSDGTGCPAKNARKDMVIDVTQKTQPVIEKFGPESAPPAPPTIAEGEALAASCPADPKAAALEFGLAASSPIGFNRDTCHYSGTCSDGNFGDKNWDRAAYLAANHPGVTASAIAIALANGSTGGTLTRYDIYQWEMADPANRMTTRRVVSFDAPKISGPKTNQKYQYGVRTQCSYPAVKYGSTAYPAQKDRRILPVVAANCAALNGAVTLDEKFTLLRVFDVFLTEPSAQRSVPGVTDNKEIYGEVIGPANTFESGSGLQYYARNKPYLVR